jgi:hypothetical protein
LYRRLGGPQGRSGHVRKISPPLGFDPRTVQPVGLYGLCLQNNIMFVFLCLKECSSGKNKRVVRDFFDFGDGRKTSLFEKVHKLRPLDLLLRIVLKLRLKIVKGIGLK